VAIRNLGLLSSGRTGAELVALYRRETAAEIKNDIVQALFVQGNARALVDLARAEKDPQRKRTIVRQLSHMDDKAATDFMLEILER
jgi:HEAT repeat protein